MREVITLEKMNVKTIYQVFEDAFTDYFVTFEKNPELHIHRWISNGVDFALSYGVKVDGKLAAFLLHAPREDFVMNLATGVRREFQGQGLAGLMYERLDREIPEMGFKSARLEVITENVKAIRAYEKSGFRKTRLLHAWKGELTFLSDIPGHYSVSPPLMTREHEILSPWPHAFEQDNHTVMKRSGELEMHELRNNGQLIAYAVFHPFQMNMVQLGGRSKESIEGLLSRMKLSGENIGMVNVDEKNILLNETLKTLGLENFLSQYAMEKGF